MFDGSLSFDQVQRLLQDEEACIRVLFDARWPDGFRCPRCGRSSYSLISTRSLPLYECSRCRKQTSLIAGTVFQGTRTPLRLWFQAIYLHSRPGGVNALQLSEEIGVTYKTAWSICHKLRHAMSHAEAGELLEGWVRIQDAAIIHRATPTLEWQPQEQSVLIGASEDDKGRPGRVKIVHQDKRLLRGRFASPDPSPFVEAHVAPSSRRGIRYTRRIHSDRHLELLKIVREAESWLTQVFRGIGPKHLQAYLNHYCYIRNRQNRSVFGDLLRWCSATPPLPYPVLIRKAAGRAGRPVRTAGSTHRTAAG